MGAFAPGIGGKDPNRMRGLVISCRGAGGLVYRGLGPLELVVGSRVGGPVYRA